MWRSRARLVLLRSSRNGRSPLQNQVRISQPPAQTPPSLPSKWASRYLTNSTLPRFFSDLSNANIEQSGKESAVAVEDGEKLGFFIGDNDGDEGSEENWSSVPKESEEDRFSSIFEGEIDKEGGSEVVVEEVVEKDEIFGVETGFGDGIVTGIERDGYVGEDLSGEHVLGGQLEGGDVDDEEVSEIDAEKIECVISVLQSSVEESLGSRLDELDLMLSEEFVVRVLQVDDISVERLIGFSRWAFKRSKSVRTSGVVDLLVEVVCSSIEFGRNEAFMLWDFLKEISGLEQEVLKTEILNQMIAGFSKLGKAKVVMEVFDKFGDLGCVPNGDTYSLAIHAFGKRIWADTALAVCDKMLSSKCFPDDEKIGKIIKFFCKGGKAKYGYSIYLAAKENGKCPPTSYLNFMVDHLSRKDDTVSLAMELLDNYSQDLQDHASEPFVSVISGLCRIKDTEKAKNLLDRMINIGLSPGKAVLNHVITAHVKAAELEDAVAMLKVMESRGMKPDIRAYNVIMSGFARGGLMDEARKIFYEARKVHSKLGRVTYHILTQGYCRIEEFENALKTMNEMKEEGIEPNVDEYRKIVQSLCLKALDWRTAEKLLEEMKQRGLQLDGNTLGLIVAVKELEAEEMRSAGRLTTA